MTEEQRPKPIEVTKLTRRQIRELLGKKPFSQGEIRYHVDLYYQLQEYRKAGGNQERAAIKSGEPPGQFAIWVQGNLQGLEDQIEVFLDEATENNTVGKWAKSVCGIGPVIAAGLLAHIDIEKAPTVGHIWRFAGLDPTQHWLGKEKAKSTVDEIRETADSLDSALPLVAQRVGVRIETLRRLATTSKKDGKPVKLTWDTLATAAAKRPWNASLKVLCWKIGESFVKVSGSASDIYGQVYLLRKEEEQKKNEAGEFKEQAKQHKVGKGTDAYAWYSQGKLPPAQIHARAKRYAVKLFLSHFHEVAYRDKFHRDPPLPYPVAVLGHAHRIPAPGIKSAE
jgi:hypothetical protein